MEEKKPSKERQKLLEERETDLWNWESIKEMEFDALPWLTVTMIGRKRVKEMLKEWAERVESRYWDIHNAHRDGQGVPKEFGVYGVKVIERSWTIYIRWFRREIRGTKVRHTVKYISLKAPKGKGSYRMSLKQFGKAYEWERVAIMEAEDEFEKIRQAAEHLENIRHAVKGIKGIVEGVMETGDEDEEPEDLALEDAV